MTRNKKNKNIQSVMWKKLNKLMAKKCVPNPNFKGSWHIVPKQIGMQCKLFMALVIQMTLWLIESELVIFIKVSQWTNTKKNQVGDARVAQDIVL